MSERISGIYVWIIVGNTHSYSNTYSIIIFNNSLGFTKHEEFYFLQKTQGLRNGLRHFFSIIFFFYILLDLRNLIISPQVSLDLLYQVIKSECVESHWTKWLIYLVNWFSKIEYCFASSCIPQLVTMCISSIHTKYNKLLINKLTLKQHKMKTLNLSKHYSKSFKYY